MAECDSILHLAIQLRLG